MRKRTVDGQPCVADNLLDLSLLLHIVEHLASDGAVNLHAVDEGGNSDETVCVDFLVETVGLLLVEGDSVLGLVLDCGRGMLVHVLSRLKPWDREECLDCAAVLVFVFEILVCAKTNDGHAESSVLQDVPHDVANIVNRDRSSFRYLVFCPCRFVHLGSCSRIIAYHGEVLSVGTSFSSSSLLRKAFTYPFPWTTSSFAFRRPKKS
jgi:hypothetical protein